MSTVTNPGRGEQPSSSPSVTRARAVPRQRAAAALLVLLAAGLLAVQSSLTYGLTAEYGFVAADLQPVDAIIALLVACVALLLLLGARSQVGARRPTTAVLGVTVLVVFAGSALGSAVLGGAAHDRRMAIVAGACSIEDREVLAGVDVGVNRSEPYGDPDGGCVLNLFPDQEVPAAVADLTAALQGDGWRTAESGADTVTLERRGAVLTLTTLSDDKTTELVLTLR